nr:immunoglobulin heavy chain junction region [Macaca mulatta]
CARGVRGEYGSTYEYYFDTW